MYLPVNKRFSGQKQLHSIVWLSILRYIWASNFLRNIYDMKKAVIALSLLALFASCKKKTSTCECVDGNEKIVFKKIINSSLNYSEGMTYCDQAYRQVKNVANDITCAVRETTSKDEAEETE